MRTQNAAITAARAAVEAAAAAKIQKETIKITASGIRRKLTAIFQKLSKSESSDTSSLSLDTFIQNLKNRPNQDYAKMYNFTKEGANAVVDELKDIGVNVRDLKGVVMMGGGNGASKTDGVTAEPEDIELSPEIVILLLAISNINQKLEESSNIQDYYIETIKTLYKINDIMETINTSNLKSIKKTAEAAAAEAEKAEVTETTTAAAEPGGEAKASVQAEICNNMSCSSGCDDEETVTEYVTKLQTGLDYRSLLEADEQLPENVSVEIRNIQKKLKTKISTSKQKDIRNYIIPGWTPVQKSSEYQEIYSERDFRAYDKCVKIGTPTCKKLGGYKGRRRKLISVVGFNSWSGNYCLRCYREQFSKKIRDSMEKNTKHGLNEAEDIIMANVFKQMTISDDDDDDDDGGGAAKSDSSRDGIMQYLLPRGQIPGGGPFQQNPLDQISARPESREDINRYNINELQEQPFTSEMGLQQTGRTATSPRRRARKDKTRRRHRSASLVGPSPSLRVLFDGEEDNPPGAPPKRSRSASLPGEYRGRGGKKKTRRKRKKKKKKTRRKR